MFYVILFALVLAVVFLPGLWVRRVMQRYHTPGDLYPHDGAEVARKLIEDLGLDVRVDEGESGLDHYDPTTRTVRLSPENYAGHSLTAVTGRAEARSPTPRWLPLPDCRASDRRPDPRASACGRPPARSLRGVPATPAARRDSAGVTARAKAFARQ
ncbi:hypothetical protein CKO31_20590 [Thiohalocapsa halophila]|uniref:Uncharacterized protein n=1 Tax=Thiohalocapsa halophila TaxID=69359 RepID=A0ABS1CMF4_9GAMM|nr:zinc metallopeptidase [Thiohalocapsa halophila]MBK1633105.1 hypothetical protein [Thiohalocapsa halophila]